MNLPAVPARWDDKWPLCIITGEPVTPAQAEQIILRTTTYLSTNDRDWERTAHRLLGLHHWEDITDEIRNTPGALRKLFQADDDARDRLGMLRLGYLYQARISSMHIDGFHGWCDWDGTIRSTDSIGKWPSENEVTEDWAMIAEAFPYLDITSQVVSLAYSEKSYTAMPLPKGRVWGTWHIKGGGVTFDPEATTLMDLPDQEQRELDINEFLNRVEHITIEALAGVMQRTRAALNAERKGLPCA